MAGIGVKLQKIYGKNTIITNLFGFCYSTMVTIAPMILVIVAIMAMSQWLGFSRVGYRQRELFACTVLYIFIFSLLVAAPFNAVLSRYMSDVIYNEKYEDILPCFYVGLLLNIALSCIVGIPFCIREYLVAGVNLIYVFTGFCGFISLVLVFYSMLYLSICKDYKKISLFFLIGMIFSILLSLALVRLLHREVTYSMLFALVGGFTLIASLELAMIRCYFKDNSGNYKEALRYFKLYWKLVLTNFLYTLGLFVHNFVFWTTRMQMIVEDTFVCAPAYDLATCLAMFTNISANVIFISRVEMYFHQRYKAYSEAVIGGRGMDIENTKKRMFMQLSAELMNLARIQFIVSVVVYFVFIIFLPQMGFSGMIFKIYPALSAGYFILFTMYAAIIFLYYFNDLTGSLMTSLVFCGVTLLASIAASKFSEIWYGMGLVAGSFAGWFLAYARLRWVERNMDVHVFCNGELLKKKKTPRPSGKVFDRYETALPKKKKG